MKMAEGGVDSDKCPVSWEALLPRRVAFGFVMVPILATSVVVGCAVFTIGCGGNKQAAATTARTQAAQSVPVGVSNVEVRDIPFYLSGLGSVTAYNTVNVKSRVDGQVVKIAFKEGENVKKGDLLVVIDPRPYEVQLSQAEAASFRDQAQLRDAKANLGRFKQLLGESGAVSQQQVDTQAATADQLEGTVRSDQAAIDSARLQITYCHITSPIDGKIGIRLVDVGNIVHAADTSAMLVITQLQPIAVLFTLPQDQLPSVANRMQKGALPVDAYSRDDMTKLATGTLLTIDNEIDPTTGTGKLKSVFDNKTNQLFPNQFVNIRLLLEVRKNTTVIPAAALQRGPQGAFVFVVKPDKTVDVRAVQIGFSQDNMTAITSGLQVNEVVVTDGQDKLQAGTHVEPRIGNPGGSQGHQNPPPSTAGTK